MMNPRDILRQAKPDNRQKGLAAKVIAAVSDAPAEPEAPKTRAVVQQIAAASVDSRHPARFVCRSDVDQSIYREVPDKSTYHIYNDDVDSFLKTFSKENSKVKGGAKIGPSMLIEALLDIAYYDMELRPEGFHNLEQLREHIRSKLK